MSNRLRFLGLMADSKARAGRIQEVPGRSCAGKRSKDRRVGMSGGAEATERLPWPELEHSEQHSK